MGLFVSKPRRKPAISSRDRSVLELKVQRDRLNIYCRKALLKNVNSIFFPVFVVLLVGGDYGEGERSRQGSLATGQQTTCLVGHQTAQIPRKFGGEDHPAPLQPRTTRIQKLLTTHIHPSNFCLFACFVVDGGD